MDPDILMRTGNAAATLWKRPTDRVQRNVKRFEVPRYQAGIDIGSDRGITADLAWELCARRHVYTNVPLSKLLKGGMYVDPHSIYAGRLS